MKPVTDPALLEQLNGPSSTPVTDPALLARLNAPPLPPLTADPAEGMGPLDKLLVGAGAATDRAMRGVTGAIASTGIMGRDADQYLQQGKEDAALYEKHHPGGLARVGEVGADLAMSALPVAGAAGKAAQLAKALRMGRAAPLIGDVAANAGYAALTAPEDRLTAGAFGAGGAAVGRAVPAVVGRVARPTAPGPEAQKLIEAGVQPTFGQVMSESRGFVPRTFARAEEAMTSIPLVGAPLRRARERAMEQFQQATREAALPPHAAYPPTREATEAAAQASSSVNGLSDSFGRAYNEIISGAEFRPGVNPFYNINAQSIENAVQLASQGLPLSHTQIDKARSAVQTIFGAASEEANPIGAHFIEKRLKEMAFKYKGSIDPEAREYGELLHTVANGWRDHWRGALPGNQAKALEAIDQQYAKFVPVRRAAATGNLTDPEAYSPKVLLRSIRAGDKTPNKTNFMLGDLPQQDLARAADKVLGNKVPDSGTTERLLVGAGVGGAGTIIAGLPGTLKSGAALYIYGLPGVQRYLTGQTGTQKWLIENLGKMTAEQQEQAMRIIYNAASQGGREAGQQGQPQGQ